ncbi:MAG TPA: hypothetical protein VH024_16645, partial [Candidatus Angelobacter sp.]|nr:hypothetical protein [Candidatus Angelobacter sp.]
CAYVNPPKSLSNVDFYLINHFLPAIPETRFHIKNKWFEAWPRWNHWLTLAEAAASVYWPVQ